MVIVKGSKNIKWLRHYRIFFIVGILILTLQIFLAAHYLPSSKGAEQLKQTQVYLQNDSEDTDGGGNSARKSRAEALAGDDEDVNVTSLKSKKYKNTNGTVTHLRLEELDFVPPCEITTKEAVSAIHRAKTQRCKQLISNITCLSLANKLYPTKLVGNCPSDGFTPGRQLGCFKDEKDFRLLSGYVGVNKKENSPNYCMKLCLQSGFPYAGVQYSNECFCGTDEPPTTSKIPDSSCNMKCPGDAHATCGGYYTINVYQTGIKRFAAQTANLEINSEGGRVKIVFLLTLNGRAVRQVLRLIKNLYHRDHYYYIHIDVRQDYLFRELLTLEKLLPNVRLTRKRFATIWGGASLLRMLRSCMNELLTFQEWQWDFVLNLSESDFPVKNITQLTDFLSANRDRNFVKSHGREVQRFIQKQGLDKTFVECDTRMWRVGDRQLPMGVQVDGGSDWVALSRSFVQYVARPEPDALVSGLLRIFNLTLLPAESFFHTALRNSKFCNTYIDNNLHVTNWKRKLGCKCQYKHIVDWCGCSPNDFRPEDWSRIQNTLPRQLYFARKFEPIINQAVVLQLELWLHNVEKPTQEVQNLHSYWQNIYHYQDLGVAPNDGLLTLGHSIKRRIAKMFSNASCTPQVGTVMQITSFHHQDLHKYTLFYLDTTGVNLEVAVKPISHLAVLTPSALMQHLEVFLVSSDYDQKEQISRNFLRILSPYSEPILAYQFSVHHTTRTYNMSCLWIDPSGLLQDVTYMLLDDSSLAGHVKPMLKQPLLPGNWTVKLVYKNSALVQLQFLVTPLEFFSGVTLSGTQASFFHRGSAHSKDSGGIFEKFLPNDTVRDVLEGVSVSNSKRQGDDLLEWIDSLASKFYSIEKVCGHFRDKIVELCGTKLQTCLESSWSSLAPDPKSAITLIDNTTGMFNIW